MGCLIRQNVVKIWNWKKSSTFSRPVCFNVNNKPIKMRFMRKNRNQNALAYFRTVARDEHKTKIVNLMTVNQKMCGNLCGFSTSFGPFESVIYLFFFSGKNPSVMMTTNSVLYSGYGQHCYPYTWSETNDMRKQRLPFSNQSCRGNPYDGTP